MASTIEWTEETWNPVVGCSIVSPGCTNCYAMKMAGRLEAMGNAPHYAGTTQKAKTGSVWTGKVTEAPESVITAPLRWRKPRTIFVNSMSDLFHEGVSDDLIVRILRVAAMTPRHTYQILTKRPYRAAAFLNHPDLELRVRSKVGVWPLPNVLVGTSVEDQVRADDRRAPMSALADAGWTTFVSYEPALGEVDWAGWEFLKWLIAGGESGPRARPLHPDWIRIARDWCGDFGVAFFFKQWGTWAPGEANSLRKTLAVDGAHWFDDSWDFVRITAAEGAEMHADDEPVVWKVGKRHSGRLLDGVEHNAMPEVARG